MNEDALRALIRQSIASTAMPLGLPSSVRGWTSSSLAPSSFLFFWVATTVPTTSPICMSGWSIGRALRHVTFVDDPDDRRVGRRLTRVERKGGLPASHKEHFLADAGTDRVESNDRSSDRIAGCVDWLQEQERDAGEVGVFERRDDVPDDASELHG